MVFSATLSENQCSLLREVWVQIFAKSWPSENTPVSLDNVKIVCRYIANIPKSHIECGIVLLGWNNVIMNARGECTFHVPCIWVEDVAPGRGIQLPSQPDEVTAGAKLSAVHKPICLPFCTPERVMRQFPRTPIGFVIILILLFRLFLLAL